MRMIRRTRAGTCPTKHTCRCHGVVRSLRPAIAGQAGAARKTCGACPDGTLLIYHLDKAQMFLGISGFGSIREVSRGVRWVNSSWKGVRPKKGAADPEFDLRVTRQGGRGLKSAAPKERGRTLWTCIVKSGVGNVGHRNWVKACDAKEVGRGVARLGPQRPQFSIFRPLTADCTTDPWLLHSRVMPYS